MTIACCKPSVFCEPSVWHASLPGKQSHVCNTAYNQPQEDFIALSVTRLSSTEAPVWSRLLLLTEKRKSRSTFNSLSYAEKDYGLSQLLPRRGWVPGLHSGSYTLAWAGRSGVKDTEAALWCVPTMASCWVFVPWLCLFPSLLPSCGIFLCQHNSVYHFAVLFNNQ